MKNLKKLIGASLITGSIFLGIDYLQPDRIVNSSVQAREEWVLLGEKTIADKLDHDTIRVTVLKGDFRKIKFRVRRHAVEIYNVVVHYGNGTSDDIKTRQLIPAGGESRVIDLKGGDRVIKKIDFWYETKSLGRERAEVKVFGRR